VFLFELNANPETPVTGGQNADSSSLATEVNPTMEHKDGELFLKTTELSIRIGIEEWSFSVVDATGRVLFEERRQPAGKKNEPGVWPLGFKERQSSEWLYTVGETGMGFDIKPNEHYYGLGEQFAGFDKRGQSNDAWVAQPHSTDNQRAYKNVPFYLSSRGYGIYVDTDDRAEFSFGGGTKSAVGGEIRVHSDSLRFLFFNGPDLDDILSRYTTVTGRPHVPPKWSFGLWASRYSYETREELERVTRRLRAEEIPCDGVHLDISWMRDNCISDLKWDDSVFPNPTELIQNLHADDYRLMLIEEPYLTAGSDAFETALKNGYLVGDDSGDSYLLDRLVVSKHRGGIIDFTNQDAVEWWQAKHRELLEMGVDGFWTDFGEYLPEDAILANGMSGRRMRNLYPDRYQQTVTEAMVVEERNPILWSRAGWTGTQRFPIHWGGDSDTTFSSMAATLRGGLSLAMSGYGFWSHDIGGFSGTPSSELYIRWAQFGLLSSHARFHGTTPREPWEFGDEALDIFRKFARLRYKHLPYLYTNAVITSDTGLPLMRPLVLHYTEDPATRAIETQYLLGRDLLVAPVIESGGSTEVYLPEDEWIDYWSGDRFEGNQTLQMDVPLGEIPLFVRAGSIIPTREPTQTVQQGPPEHLTLTARASDGCASGQYYHETKEEMTSIAVQTGNEIQLNVTGSLPETTVKVTGIEERPSQVTLNKTSADEELTIDPESWSCQEQTLTIECDPML